MFLHSIVKIFPRDLLVTNHYPPGVPRRGTASSYSFKGLKPYWVPIALLKHGKSWVILAALRWMAMGVVSVLFFLGGGGYGASGIKHQPLIDSNKPQWRIKLERIYNLIMIKDQETLWKNIKPLVWIYGCICLGYVHILI